MSEDFLPILGYDHIEFYVGNAKQAAHFYDKTFGFKPVAKLGLETGARDRASYVMQQGRIRFVLTSPGDAISNDGPTEREPASSRCYPQPGRYGRLLSFRGSISRAARASSAAIGSRW